MTRPGPGAVKGLSRVVPMVGWLRTYDRRWLRGDVIAGVTVAALIVPKNLGYAGIAGVPLQNGLYAAAAGALLYAVFGTSRQISMGPSSGPDVGLALDHVGVLTLAALALVMIGFSQTAGDARTFAAKHHYQVDINQESVAQGMANTGAGLFQGMPVSTSLSASSLNEHSGPHTGATSTGPSWPRKNR